VAGVAESFGRVALLDLGNFGVSNPEGEVLSMIIQRVKVAFVGTCPQRDPGRGRSDDF